MENAMTALHGTASHLTRPPGYKTINEIWVSKNFTPIEAAVLPIGDMQGNHRTIIVDLDETDFAGAREIC